MNDRIETNTYSTQKKADKGFLPACQIYECNKRKDGQRFGIGRSCEQPHQAYTIFRIRISSLFNTVKRGATTHSRTRYNLSPCIDFSIAIWYVYHTVDPFFGPSLHGTRPNAPDQHFSFSPGFTVKSYKRTSRQWPDIFRFSGPSPKSNHYSTQSLT